MVRGLQAGTVSESTLLDRSTLMPSHGDYMREVRLRVMAHERFLNGNALFVSGVEGGERGEVLKRYETAAVHLGSGQKDRLQRMKAMVDFARGNQQALAELPGDEGAVAGSGGHASGGGGMGLVGAKERRGHMHKRMMW